MLSVLPPQVAHLVCPTPIYDPLWISGVISCNLSIQSNYLSESEANLVIVNLESPLFIVAIPAES